MTHGTQKRPRPLRILRTLWTRILGARRHQMLAPGSVAPDFATLTHENEPLSLSDLRGSYVVLWFYPKADTPG